MACWSSCSSKLIRPFLQTWGCLPPPRSREARLPALVAPGSAAGCGSGACDSTVSPPVIPGDDKRSGDTKTGVCSYHNPHHQGKSESPKHLAAHQEPDEHGEKG